MEVTENFFHAECLTIQLVKIYRLQNETGNPVK